MDAGCNLEGYHVRRDIHARNVEGQRRDATIIVGIPGRWKIPVSGLFLGAFYRRIQADFDNLIVRATVRRRHVCHLGMCEKVDETTKILGVDLKVPPPRATPYRPAGPLNAGPKSRHHILVRDFDSVTRQRTFSPDDTVLPVGCMICSKYGLGSIR